MTANGKEFAFCLCFTGVWRASLAVLGRGDTVAFNLPEYFSIWNVHSKFGENQITIIDLISTFYPF